MHRISDIKFKYQIYFILNTYITIWPPIKKKITVFYTQNKYLRKLLSDSFLIFEVFLEIYIIMLSLTFFYNYNIFPDTIKIINLDSPMILNFDYLYITVGFKFTCSSPVKNYSH